MKLTIEVTAADIANGKPNDCDACPIALAVKRAYPEAENVEIDGDGSFEILGVTHYSLFPPEARDFVGKFDSEENRPQVKPFAFEAEFEPRVYGYHYDDEDD